MSWMLWIGGALIGVVALLVAARSAFRRAIRAEIVEFLRARHPDWRLEEQGGHRLRITIGADEAIEVQLANLFFEVSRIRTPDANADQAARRDVYSRYFEDALAEARELHGALAPDAAPRVLPMIVDGRFLAELRRQGSLPSRALPGTTLHVVYVLDGRHSVAYLTDDQLTELELDADGLHALALGNLRGRMTAEPVRTAVEKGSVVVVRSGDAFDASRLLLVGEHLRPGEAVAAAVPDRDTLVLAPVPADGDWSGLRQVASSPESERSVLARPLRVTSDSFTEV